MLEKNYKTSQNAHIPEQSGIYIFFDLTGSILYIGKAKNIRMRLLSYFRPNRDSKTEHLLEEYVSISWIITHNELHALLLEAALINEYKPKYNILLKDGSPFTYIRCSDKGNNDLPKIDICRTKQKEDAVYFGPYLQRKNAHQLVEFLRKVFQLQICNKTVPSGCLDYHLGRCAGSCTPNFNTDEYRQRYYAAKALLLGKKNDCLRFLQTQIDEYNQQLNFEQSQKTLELIEQITPLFDLRNYQQQARLYKDQLTQILVEKLPEQDTYDAVAQELQDMLSLSKQPKSIDCFDISHCQGKHIVAACVRFYQGKPDYPNYQRFIIRTLNQQDDYKALQEAITRRYKNPEKIPDLVVIDGGKGQLHAAQEILNPLEIPCISLAKREERLFFTKQPEGVLLSARTPVGKLLISLRNNTHHQAISLHRTRARKTFS